MTAVGSAGGGAMMMWVATHNEKVQERANEATAQARDMLDVEKEVTRFRQQMATGDTSPETLQRISKEISDYLEAHKDEANYHDIEAQLKPMADNLAYRSAKGIVAQVANRKYPTAEDIAKAKEAVKDPTFRANYPEITKAIENGHFEGREYVYKGTNWREIDANKGSDGKDDDGAQAFDRDDGTQKEVTRLQKETEDFANMTSKERELLMTSASEQRDAARQANEQGAKLISSQNSTGTDIINNVYRA